MRGTGIDIHPGAALHDLAGAIFLQAAKDYAEADDLDAMYWIRRDIQMSDFIQTASGLSPEELSRELVNRAREHGIKYYQEG